ncbi:MAG: hypothetical protein RQ826_16145 [Xanthomonadales bacterium]|nr:hypothetical protein [Xanthomonadales bacterium]
MAGYSNTPLVKKLGIQAGSEVLLVSAPEGYRKLLEPLPDAVGFVSRISDSTDIIEGTVREIALPMGFVDIKVCAVDEIWSGLKLVIRRELR